jgi:N-acetyl-gamma-glutamyl-phosphate reductase
MQMRAGIIGVTGYGGLEVFRLLSTHHEIEDIRLYTSTREGTELSVEAPHIKDIYGGKLSSIDRLEGDDLDVLFCSAPSGVSTELLPALINSNPSMKVIDLAGDFRIKDAQIYSKWYGKVPPPQSTVNKAVYGLSEWNEQGIKEAEFVSNPGCYPTAVLLGVLPLLREGIIKPHTLIIDAKSGISGAGASPNKAAHFPKANDSMSIYKMNKHQHIPEIEQAILNLAGFDTNITFSTHLVPMTRGILATMYAEVNEGVSLQRMNEVFHDCYDSKSFVRIFQEGSDLFTKQVYGSNYCDLTFSLDERTNRVTVVAVIDNLVKGAAGQAVQNMNMMYGLDEKAGLKQLPLFP